MRARCRGLHASALLIATIGSIIVGAAPAQSRPEDDGILTLQFENDLFGNTDGHFTHGTRIAWMSPENAVPGWVMDAADHLPLFDAQASKHIVWSLGQNMYTPADISNPDLIPDDRPYAGWLYVGVGLISVDEHRLENLELNVGMVGPASLAEQTHRSWHRIFGLGEPRGWDHQLENEPGILLLYDRKWRAWQAFDIMGLETDITPNVGVALGNVFTHAQAGITVRIGHDLPLDYGPPRIQPSLPGSDYFLPEEGFGWYVFAGVTGRAVLWNIFLDGNTFADSHDVNKRPFVGDFQVGLAVTVGRARLAYTHILRTREFEGQDEADNFGSLSLSVRF